MAGILVTLKTATIYNGTYREGGKPFLVSDKETIQFFKEQDLILDAKKGDEVEPEEQQQESTEEPKKQTKPKK